MHVCVRPGDAVTRATVLLRVWPGVAVDETGRAELAQVVNVQSERDVSQDSAFGLRQLADIAVRALSPGVNDPTSAMTCIAYLRDLVEALADRDLAARPRHVDERGVLVHAEARGFRELLRESFEEIGRFAHADARVAVAVVDALAGVGVSAVAAGAPGRAADALELAEEIARPALEDARTESDRLLLEASLSRVRVAAAG